MTHLTQETSPPENIHCLALNYPGVSETGSDDPPLYFVKSASCFSLGGGVIDAPEVEGKFWTECELGIIVSKNCSFVSPEEAPNCIKGYVICGDLTCENVNQYDHHLAYSKSRIGFCPTSSQSRMISQEELNNAVLETYINGEIKQRGYFRDSKLNAFESLAYVSSITHLTRNDLILTGTPLGWQHCMLKPGDAIRQKITGLVELEYKIGGRANG